MAKEKAPAMMFYGREFYSDENVMVLTLEQEAVYLRLLWNCWQEGSIPASASKLAAMSKNTPVGVFELEVWPALRDLFMVRDDGRLMHQKVEALRVAKEDHSNKMSRNGKLGNDKRYGKTGPKPSPDDSELIAEPVAKPSPDDSELIAEPVAKPSPDDSELIAEPVAKSRLPISDFRLPTSECKELSSNTCAPRGARLSESSIELAIDDPPFETPEPHTLVLVSESPDPQMERRRLQVQQDQWFEEWWAAYWLKKSRKRARESFGRRVQTEARFQEVMEATRAQSAEMLSREPAHRPHGGSWINGERWNDEVVGRPGNQVASHSPYVPYSPPVDGDNTESYEDLLARARQYAAANASSANRGSSPYVPYKPPA